MRHLQLFIFLLTVTLSSFSQENKIQKGDEDFEKFAYINSRQVYLKVAEKVFESQNLYQHLGDSYYFTAELVEAEKWYQLLFDKYEEEVSPEYYFRFAQSLKSVEKYSEADVIMDKFYKANPLDSRAVNFENKKNYLDFIEMQSGKFELIPITMNSENSDFAPSFYNGKLIFASSRTKGNTSKKNHKWNDQPFSDLYVTDQGKEQTEVSGLSSKINTKFHESTAALTEDGNTIYFTRNNYTNKKLKKNSSGVNLLKLYRSVKEDGKWQKAEDLPFNSDEYSVAHPALSPDEKTLYFASDMPGGKGQSDLYKVNITEDGFGTPESLGDKINTEGRETFPFVAKNNNLYFSSNGHPGLGGLDLYIASQNLDGSYGKPYNTGKPLNSPLDDFTFIINPETGIGYFASNRSGGMGSDDIYSFKQNEELIKSCIQSLNGVVFDTETNLIIPGAVVLLLDVQGDSVAETISGIDGSFSFDPIYCERAYAIRANKIDYESDEISFISSSILLEQIKKSLYLNPKFPIVIGADINDLLEPIYFDLDKSNIRPDAAIELQKVIAIMEQYPDLKIDVRSHTDSRAGDNYNMRLSERRAKSTMKYIIDKGGVAKERISGRGYGESSLINDCSNGVDCSDTLHELNRRSEFIILE